VSRLNSVSQSSAPKWIAAPDAQGGGPIKVGNETIGGIGVSDAPAGDKAEACANTGLAKIS
jgi:uncharacterized protein GlcG (DUF336 family)